MDAYIFENLDDVRSVTEDWVKDYSYERPHESLGGLSPVMWKNGQQAQAKASAIPDRFFTSDYNNSNKILKKNLLFKCTEKGELTSQVQYQVRLYIGEKN